MLIVAAMIFVMIVAVWIIIVWIIFKRVNCVSGVQFSAMVSVISLPIRVVVA